METDEAKENIGENKKIPEKSDPKPDPNPIFKKTKKINWKRLGIAIAIIVIALIIILSLFLRKPQATTEMLNISYTTELGDDTAIDSATNVFALDSVASTLGFETNKLDQEISGMEIGEEKTITLEAKDAYGEYDENLVFNYNRSEKIERQKEINKTQEISIDDFKDIFDEQPILNQEYSLEGMSWKYKVIEVSATNVKISIETNIGEEIPSGFFISKVIDIKEDKIILELEGENTVIPSPNGNVEIKFEEDYVYFILTPEIGEWIEFENLPEAKVTGMNETHIFLDANPELAGKKIIIKIILNNKFKEKTMIMTGSAVSIPRAPTMQVFIMSYCPYGLQMLKGMLPVMEKFQDKANIELRFVGYTMHGQKEEDENYRMICLREEQYSKLIDYLKCFAESGDVSSCLKQASVDESKLNSCMASKAAQYFEEDKALNEKYGVKGSPTTVINGQVVEVWPRSPEDIKQKLCEAFTTPPAECSETLNTENPSPGFGGGTSTQGGSC